MHTESLQITQHNADFSTSPQVSPQAMAAVAQAGFKTVINNRPDGEGGPDQPRNQDIAAAAKAAGLAYHYLPVVSGQYSAADIAAMAQVLQDASKPIFCFCRSGARSTQLYQLAKQSI